MRVAIVGCGFVADFYMQTLSLHPELELVGAMDRDSKAAARFCRHYSVPTYASLDDLLNDRRVELVLNLTNPGSHYSVTKSSLLAGKHVYSEKPLALSLAEAEELVSLADRQGVHLSGAPCRLLGETAQTMWKVIREGSIGTIRLAYAEMDDGLVHRMPYRKWFSASGAPWPFKDEFESGCTLEHAGYAVTWLIAFFGPAESVTAFSSCLIPDKETDLPLELQAPDFSVACIKFASGSVARLTCSIIAPRDHSIRVFGDEGLLYTEDCWRSRSPVYIRRPITIRRRTMTAPWKTRVPLVGGAKIRRRSRGLEKVDFCLGIAELAEAVRQGRRCRLSARYCLHVTELVLAIHSAVETGGTVKINSSLDAIEPMPWAT